MSSKERPTRHDLLIPLGTIIDIVYKGATSDLEIQRKLDLPETSGVLEFLKDVRTTLGCSRPPSMKIKAPSLKKLCRILGLPPSCIEFPSDALIQGMVSLQLFKAQLGYKANGSWNDSARQLEGVVAAFDRLRGTPATPLVLEVEEYSGIEAAKILSCKPLALEYRPCEVISIISPTASTYGVAIGPHRRRLDAYTADPLFCPTRDIFALPTRRLPKTCPEGTIPPDAFRSIVDPKFQEEAARVANTHWRIRAEMPDPKQIPVRSMRISFALDKLHLREIFPLVPKKLRRPLVIAATQATALCAIRDRLGGSLSTPSISSILNAGRALLPHC